MDALEVALNHIEAAGISNRLPASEITVATILRKCATQPAVVRSKNEQMVHRTQHKILISCINPYYPSLDSRRAHVE
jgi:hypothetical protein